MLCDLLVQTSATVGTRPIRFGLSVVHES